MMAARTLRLDDQTKTITRAVSTAVTIFVTALLMGLTIAGDKTPGDTFQLIPRTATHMALSGTHSAADTPHASGTLPEQSAIAGLYHPYNLIPLAILTAPLGLDAFLLPCAMVSHPATPLAAYAIETVSCRGPPTR